MREFTLCFVLFFGLFLAIDFLFFEGENGAGAWQEVQRLGEKFSNAINGQVGQIWR